MYVCVCAYPRTTLVSVVILHHVLQDEVAVELVWVVILVPPAAMLVGPLHHQLRVLPGLWATLEVFLHRQRQNHETAQKPSGKPRSHVSFHI